MKKLKYGSSQFDKLSHQKLLRLAQKMFCALSSAEGCLSTVSHGRDEPFWTKGAGFRTVAMTHEALEDAACGYDAETIYRSFYRMTKDLLFRNQAVKSGWLVCKKCGSIVARPGGPGVDSALVPGSKCCIPATPGDLCKGTLRPLRWSDIKGD